MGKTRRLGEVAGVPPIYFTWGISMAKRTLIEVRIGRNARKRLKVGEYQITLKLPDAQPGVLVEILKEGEPITAGYLNPAGLFTFDDEIDGINPIIYTIMVKGKFYGRIIIYPIIIDANEILEDTLTLTKSILFSASKRGWV